MQLGHQQLNDNNSQGRGCVTPRGIISLQLEHQKINNEYFIKEQNLIVGEALDSVSDWINLVKGFF